MLPILIDLGTYDLPLIGETHLFLPTYGVLFATGVLAAWWWFMRRARGFGIPEERLFNLTFYSLLAGIVGAKLTLVLVDFKSYLEHPADLLGTIRSAGVVIGGVIAGATAFILYCRRNGLPLWRLADAIAAPLALGQAIGRIGCFSAGCCWGAPAAMENAFAVTFTSSDTQTGVPLHQALIPTQLMHMGHALFLAVALTWLWRREDQREGVVFWVYVVLYSVGRGLIEFWRDDSQRGLYFGDEISTSQILALLGLVVGVAMLVRARRSGTAGSA